MTTETAIERKPAGIGRPPIPHEHGAWVILYAPIVIALAAAPPPDWLSVVLLVIGITGAFLGRNVLALALRKRADVNDRFWLVVYTLVTAASAVPLLFTYGRWQLLDIAGLAIVLFAIHSLLLLIPSRKRLDRSQWGEILAVGALSLTAPAAYIVARGSVDAVGMCIWVACTLYFSSGIFFVKMWLNAVKHRDGFGLRERWVSGRDNVIYHVLLIGILAMIGLHLGGRGAILSTLAYAPAVVRALVGWLLLKPKLPRLKRVGVMETVYAVWFTVLFITAIRIDG
jgi:hypothetical protein